MPTLDNVVGEVYKTPSKEGSIGLELEIEGSFENFSNPTYWRSVPEGSLRNGCELALITPCNIDKIPSRIEDYKKAMAKCKLVPSIRTSVHMHINVQRETFRSVFSFMMAYWMFENILVRLNGRNREGNLHCLRLSDAKGIYSFISKGLRSGNILDKQFLSSEYRYGALNLCSIPKFGSIEFRFMRFPDDIDDITEWVQELWNFWTTAKTLTPQEIIRISELPANTILNQFFSPKFVARIKREIPMNVIESFIAEHALYQIMLDEDLKYASSLHTVDGEDVDEENYWAIEDDPQPVEIFAQPDDDEVF
jgi:hypothetical protein